MGWGIWQGWGLVAESCRGDLRTHPFHQGGSALVAKPTWACVATRVTPGEGVGGFGQVPRREDV